MSKMVENNTDRLILEDKMDDWGPFGRHEGEWLIFSVGNPIEGHGYALPRNVDDLVSQNVAHRIALKTGSRYIAHIPWTTDHAGEAARDWAPKYVPEEEFIENVIDFIQFHIKTCKKAGLSSSKVIIFSGHGGNEALELSQQKIKDNLEVEELVIATGEILTENINLVMVRTKQLAEKMANSKQEQRKLGNIFVKILLGTGHASHMEHSMAAAVGVLDNEKLIQMNNQLEQDFEGTLERFPPVGGLGGYLLKGGIYEDALGSKKDDKYGLWNCLESLRALDNGKVHPVKELGELVLEMIIELYSNKISQM
ncbi:MAG: hypothetical protein GF317_08020 [Candidatus Lokiarchaeota archaeon]|nr:hypothetical protein [Candidatus Lokiarchaeota archaeon]MBD3199659.1 hypothetical protein [Candidatus Lokiarchaeota archaeon]